METRPPNIEGRGEIKQRGLVKNALRMRPDRVILGEVRGEEAFDMLQAMNTGHEGSMATLHANTPRDALTRLEQMVAMGDMKITPEAVAGQIASAVGLIVQATRLSDGQRKITSVLPLPFYSFRQFLVLASKRRNGFSWRTTVYVVSQRPRMKSKP